MACSVNSMAWWGGWCVRGPSWWDLASTGSTERASVRVGQQRRQPLQALQRIVILQTELPLLGAERGQFEQPVADPLGVIEVAWNMGVRRRQLWQHLAQSSHQIRIARRHRRGRGLWLPLHLPDDQAIRLALARFDAEHPITQA